MYLPYYYIKNDPSKEKLGQCLLPLSRLGAAKYFASRKQLPLKEFLKIFSISK